MANKNKTPFIRPLREHGATLYMFPSAAEDVGLNINGRTTGVAMSHYALLNLTKENFQITSANELALSLQNYMMNCEVLITNDDLYNYQDYQTETEHVFWKWIQKYSTLNPSMVGSNSGLYREYNYGCNVPNRLVQCVGQIDAANSLSTNYGMFNEIYITVPTSYGNGPVFFRKNNNLKISSVNGDAYLAGRSRSSSVGYLGSDGSTPIYDSNGSGYTFGSDYGYEIVMDMPSIQSGLRYVGIQSADSFSSLDDVNIDSYNNYREGVKNSQDYKGEYDMSKSRHEFKFNTILLYYSVYDNNDLNKSPLATNLFGIVFLDGFDADNGYINPFTKKKSFNDEIDSSSTFGSGFSWRVNLKTASIYDSLDNGVSDDSTANSMYSSDFNDVIANFNRAIETMNTNVESTTLLQRQTAQVLSYYTESKDSISQIEQNLKNLVDDQYAENERTHLDKNIKSISYTDGEDNYGSSSCTINTDENKKCLTIDAEQLLALNGEKILIRFKDPNSDTNLEYDLGQIISKVMTMGNTMASMMPTLERKSNISPTMYVESRDDSAVINEVEFTDDSSAPKTMGIGSLTISSPNDNGNVQISEDGVISSVEDTSDADETSTETTNNDPYSAFIINCRGIHIARQKKPTEEGFYLKQNTAGEIQNIAHFDGETFDSTIKCQIGKIYVVDGLGYVFNGTTCKLIGSN